MLFTILVDFRGGTYISQTEASDAFAAVRQWSTGVSDADLRSWKLRRATALLSTKEHPIAIIGLRNCWCVSALQGDHLLLLNLVGTAKMSAKANPHP